MIYALLVKSNKYINIRRPTNVSIFYSGRSLLKLNFRLYVVYLGNHSVKINTFTCKKNMKYNVHNLNGDFLHIQMQKI